MKQVFEPLYFEVPFDTVQSYSIKKDDGLWYKIIDGKQIHEQYGTFKGSERILNLEL